MTVTFPMFGAAAPNAAAVAASGDPHGRLLAGPPAAAGWERIGSHLTRLGPLSRCSPDDLRAEITDACLLGRGGAGFPLGRKLEMAAGARGHPLVVVNGSEGEPASRKDQELLELRPHLVLDGAVAAAIAVGGDEIVIGAHRGRDAWDAVAAAIAERAADGIRCHMVDLPPTYLAGESSALVSFVNGGAPLPRSRGAPAALQGIAGRPTVLSNVETFAHLALIARLGPAWFCQAGSRDSPGSTLVTVNGDVRWPGKVLEVLRPVTIGELVEPFLPEGSRPRAVLVGGYAGTWVEWVDARSLPLDRGKLSEVGAPLGCGVLCVLGSQRCGLAETLRLLEWFAAGSAGQCGPCALGLPQLAAELNELVASRPDRRVRRRLNELASSIAGRGGCHFPDGAVHLVESALQTFGAEVSSHRSRRGCNLDHRAYFPLGAFRR
jgi:NADH:ubiquinone oxidoreductase subunit F (NADH-binding)